MNCMTKEDLKIVIEEAGRIFKEIKRKYVGLSGYLVFSSRYGQCALSSDSLKILTEFPNMVQDSDPKEKALALIALIRKIETAKKIKTLSPDKKVDLTQQQENAERDLQSLLDLLEFKDDPFVEIRFVNTSLDLIFDLQADPLVFQEHTPQSRASIRIVLGTVHELYQRSTAEHGGKA
jgi:hypothetical protein